MNKLSEADIAFAKESVERVRVIAEETKMAPPKPALMKMISHMDARGIVNLWDYGSQQLDLITEEWQKTLTSLKQVKECLQNGGKREDVMKIVDAALNKSN